MNWSYIQDRDWREFERRFDGAAMFLLEASLRGELAHLESMGQIGTLNPTLANRLTELRLWKATHEEIERRHASALPAMAVVNG